MNAEIEVRNPMLLCLSEGIESSGKPIANVARDLGTTPERLTELVDGRESLTAEMAIRLGRYFGTTPEYWLNMESGFHLHLAKRELGDRIETEVQPLIEITQ